MSKELTVRQGMLAIAQVFEDYPEVFTTGANARDFKGYPVVTDSAAAKCFCTTGIIWRMRYEKIFSLDVLLAVMDLLNSAARDKGQRSLTYCNDMLGREAIIKLCRETV